jgi:putative CocE/NonD family hydrolase
LQLRTGAAVVVLAALSLAATKAARTDARPDLKSRYTKYEYRIGMRDGVKLFTTVYVPRNAGKDRRYPILLTRTPYGAGPYGDGKMRDDLGPSEAAALDGFIFAYQDVRGRFMSEGQFVDVRPYRAAKGQKDVDESSDAWDTIDFLVKRVRHNSGRVGVWGISYPGFYAAMAAIDAHPALAAVSPQAPIADWFVGDDFHHNGAFFLPHAFNFYASFGRSRPEPTATWGPPFDHGTADGYRFFLEAGPLPNLDLRHLKGEVAFWKEVMAHETYDGFWQARNTRPHLRDIRPSMLTVGGWYDAEDLFGALETYKAIEKQSPGRSNRLVMGPWSHGGWARGTGESLGKVRFGEATARFFQEKIELPFFREQLKDGRETKLPESWVFETGRNEWRSFEAWPPRGTRSVSLYLGAGGRLTREAPTAAGEAWDEYVSDPGKPVPYLEDVHIGMQREYMVADQRFAGRRPDVLVYQTEPLEHDLTVAGPISASLNVSTSGSDSDWVVKLIDVYPDDVPLQADEKDQAGSGKTYSKLGGYQQLVRGEPFRGKFRRSYSKPEPFVPGQVDTVAFTMPDAFHTFRRGHRVMVQVQSSWFPLVDRNPQKFVNIREAAEADFQKATQRVWRSAQKPSFVRLETLAR